MEQKTVCVYSDGTYVKYPLFDMYNNFTSVFFFKIITCAN